MSIAFSEDRIDRIAFASKPTVELGKMTVRSPLMRFMPGDVLDLEGRYSVSGLLGIGGMSEVYEVLEAETGRKLAAKVVSISKMMNPDVIRRLNHEYRILHKLSSINPGCFPAVHGLHGDRETAGNVLLMDVLEGELLEEYLGLNTLSLERKLRLLVAIAGLLENVHLADVIWRDLKEANINVLPVGDDFLVKGFDFGIASELQSANSDSQGVFLGTPTYMAPEIWEGSADDVRSDIYAFGVLAYRVLYGRDPFLDLGVHSLIRAHCREIPELADALGLEEEVDIELEMFVFTLMGKKPSYRFQTAAQVRTFLQQYLVRHFPDEDLDQVFGEG